SRARSRTRGRSRIEGTCAGVVATSIRGTPVRGLAVLAVDRGVAVAEPVLGDTALDDPLGGIFLRRRQSGLAPVSRVDLVCVTEVHVVPVALQEQAGRHMH